MKPSYFTYGDYFRGKVYIYNGSNRDWIACGKVRKSKLKALEDAKKLMAQLRKEKQSQPSTL